MAWLEQFKLGVPGYEYTFEVNPEAIQITEAPIAVLQRNLAGDLKKSVIRSSAPTIRINSSYLSIQQKSQLSSLAQISNTFLSFQVRDDLAVYGEYSLPQDATHLILQNNSATRLSAALVSAGFAGDITIIGVGTVPDTVPVLYGLGGYGDGPYPGDDYFTGGSYDDLTRTVTLGTPLPDSTKPAYVGYLFRGWLVNMEQFAHTAQGGWVDRFSYDFQLTGA